MKRGYIVLTFVVMFFLFLPFAFGAGNDIWKKCTQDAEFNNPDPATGFSCCFEDGIGTWTENPPTFEICTNNIDDNCNGLIDWADPLCSDDPPPPPSGDPCIVKADCTQSNCVIESCQSGFCVYVNRPSCDSTECSAGQFCDAAGGTCQDPDSSSSVCLNCVTDTTADLEWSFTTNEFEDAGIGFGSDLFNSDSGNCPIASCEPDQDCTCFDGTGTTNIQHKAALTTGLCCGNDPNEFYKPDQAGLGECTSDVNDCIWSTGDAQKHDSGNEGWWCFEGRWEECTSSADIGKVHGSVKCTGTGSGWTLGSDPENTYGPTACSDLLDNDADGLTDCEDPDCAGSISGNVQNSNNNDIQDGIVDALQAAILKYTDTTDNLGNYQMVTVLCGSYDMITSAIDYVSSTQSIQLQPNQNLQVDFTLVLGTACETDCTYAGDNTIHKECNNINGCNFFDATAMEVCNLAQPGWSRDYSETQVIECAEGNPTEKIETKATVTCELENLLKLTKVVTYKGKLTKLVVITCG